MSNPKVLSLSILFLTLVFSSCEDADDNGNLLPSDNMAFDIISNDPQLSVLSEALELTGLSTTLDNPNELTVFAPTNAAFNQFLNTNAYANIQDIPVGVLRDLLRYHQYNGEFTTDLLNPGYYKSLATDEQGEALDLFVNEQPNLILNGYAAIDPVQRDIDVDNGVIHVIDQVLELPTLAQLIEADVPELSVLNTAIEQQGLDITLSTTDGSMQGPYTVFAPTDAAFQALVDESSTDNINSIQDILDRTDLTDILLYHVKPSPRLRSGDITDGIIIDPITTGTFVINTNSGTVITDANNRSITVIGTNITAINGVLHKVDLVLLP